jgi:hypothetical protein
MLPILVFFTSEIICNIVYLYMSIVVKNSNYWLRTFLISTKFNQLESNIYR